MTLRLKLPFVAALSAALAVSGCQTARQSAEKPAPTVVDVGAPTQADPILTQPRQKLQHEKPLAEMTCLEVDAAMASYGTRLQELGGQPAAGSGSQPTYIYYQRPAGVSPGAVAGAAIAGGALAALVVYGIAKERQLDFEDYQDLLREARQDFEARNCGPEVEAHKEAERQEQTRLRLALAKSQADSQNPYSEYVERNINPGDRAIDLSKVDVIEVDMRIERGKYTTLEFHETYKVNDIRRFGHRIDFEDSGEAGMFWLSGHLDGSELELNATFNQKGWRARHLKTRVPFATGETITQVRTGTERTTDGSAGEFLVTLKVKAIR